MRYLCTHLPSPVVSVLFILSSLTLHLALSLNTTQVQLMKEISNHMFYWKWNGSSYVKDWKWNTSSDPCQWHGVICSENGGDVVELDMSDSEYGIEFNKSIFQIICKLPAIQRLNLSHQGLADELPQELNECTRLNLIDLSYNYISSLGGLGSLGGLRSLANLTTLLLPSNSFYGNIPVDISVELLNMTGLKTLDLSHNYLSGLGGLGSLANLKTLLLPSNSFYGNIPVELLNMTGLETLDLSHNYLSNLGGLGSLANLKTLLLPSNFFYGNIPVELLNMTGLESLDLSSNILDGSIPPQLFCLSNLRALDLSHNLLSGGIPQNFSRNLFRLDLSDNKLTGKIPDSLKNIRILNLSKNELIYKNPMGRVLLIKILGTVGAVAVFIICCLLLGVLWIRKLHNKTGFKQEMSKILQKVEHPRISYEELLAATNRFHNSNLLATNSLGSVYKGFLTDGTRVAVKVLNLMHEESDKIFRGECKVLQKVRHRNLARIITTCSTRHFKALIFEYFSNGSLEKHLYQHRCRLGLRKVLNIAIDIAHAVEYLHYDCYVHIVHCDIKPSNVLLDESMTAHLSDFGISRLMGKIAVNSVTSTIDLRGSVGYIAPEYGLSGIMSPRGDVYSYGIMLLEMLTSKSPTDSMFDGGLNLHNWVNRAFPDRAFEVVDKSLLMEGAGKETEECLISLMGLGLLCSKDSPEARPTMRDVSNVLKNIQQDCSTDTSSSIKLRPTISNLVCDRGAIINSEEASDTQSSTF